MRWRRSSAAVILLTLTTVTWTQAQKKFADKVEKVLKKSTTEKPKILPGKKAKQ